MLEVVQQQAIPAELFEQGLDLSVLQLDNLLLALIDEATGNSQPDVPRLEHERRLRDC